jgi:hypothetical protein
MYTVYENIHHDESNINGIHLVLDQGVYFFLYIFGQTLYSLTYEKTNMHYILARREYYFCEMNCLCTCFMYYLKIYETI